MQKVQLTYKFRLYPKKGQEERLLETLELCRQTYNYFLAQWNGTDKTPSRLELQAQLPKLKSLSLAKFTLKPCRWFYTSYTLT